ncbi:MAG: hypothetical protein KDB01_08785, partial [Planctomycetaceae bacterium]|nr:hypothetical protein [Planctomycetaceae bacterium]
MDPRNSAPTGIALNPAGGTDLWVVDKQDDVVYYYASGTTWTSGSRTATSTFALNGANGGAEGIVDPVGPVTAFVGTSDTSWNVASNWSSGVVPGIDDDVLIPTGKSVTIDKYEVSVRSLSLAGTLTIISDSRRDKHGVLKTSAASTVDIGGVLIMDEGLLQGTGALTIDGTLKGSGTIDANVINAGTVSPGNPYGVLTINGDYTQTSSGVLASTAAGPIAGASYGQLNVQRVVTLDGHLQFEAVYPNQPGDIFRLITQGSPAPIFGTFMGFAEGELVPLGLSTARVSYRGGGGNTFELTTTGIRATVSSISRPQASSGIVDYEFTVSLSSPSNVPLTYHYETRDLTATAGADYLTTEGTLTFAPGVTSRTLTVHVLGNSVAQLTKSFQLVVTRSEQAESAEVIGIGTIAGTLLPPMTASSVGKDFWVTFHKPGMEYLPETTTLYISSVEGASGTVTIPGLNFSQAWSVGPNEAVSVTLPNAVTVQTADGIESKGIHVVSSDNAISVYGLHHSPHSSDGFTAVATETLGTEYRILTYGNVGALRGTDMSLVATEDNTTILITPGDTFNGTNAGAEPFLHEAGVPYSITLNAGQSYQFRNEDGEAANADLTGTRIVADKVIAVFAGHYAANVPGGAIAADELLEQLLPVEAWGTEYLSVPLALRTGDTFRILADQDDTVVAINGAAVATLNAGEFYETTLSIASRISANQPILVAQFANSYSFDFQLGDPFLMLLTPTRSFSRTFTVTTPTWTQFGQLDDTGDVEGIVQHDPEIFLNLVVPSSAVSTITMNDVPLAIDLFSSIGSSGYSGAQIQLVSNHFLELDYTFASTDTDVNIAGYLYGLGRYNGFGVPANFVGDQIELTASISVTPMSEIVFAGDRTSVTAQVLDEHQQPVPGVPVTFTIAGVNRQGGVAYTDALG